MRTTRTRAALVALTTALVLGACSAGDDGPADPPAAGGPRDSTTGPTSPTAGPATDVTEVQPGRPGEPSSTVIGAAEQRWNHDDVAFVQMMVPHHRQALELAALAPDRAEDPRVLALAERIAAAQAPEVLVLASLLDQRGVDVPRPGEDPRTYDHAEHGHHAMQGMLTSAQLAELADAQGDDFDRLFLQRMIDHHAGAVAMAADVRRTGSSRRVAELALDMGAGQAAEIARMQDLALSLR